MTTASQMEGGSFSNCGSRRSASHIRFCIHGLRATGAVHIRCKRLQELHGLRANGGACTLMT
eukprot:4045734-Pyramimonas_sp.AAC.1